MRVDTIDSLRRGSPPLTYLKPSGRTQEVRVGSQRFSVVEVEPFLPYSTRLQGVYQCVLHMLSL